MVDGIEEVYKAIGDSSKQEAVMLDPTQLVVDSTDPAQSDVDSQNTECRLKNAVEELENLMKDMQEVLQVDQKVLEDSLETLGKIDAPLVEVLEEGLVLLEKNEVSIVEGRDVLEKGCDNSEELEEGNTEVVEKIEEDELGLCKEFSESLTVEPLQESEMQKDVASREESVQSGEVHEPLGWKTTVLQCMKEIMISMKTSEMIQMKERKLKKESIINVWLSMFIWSPV
jgi:hypothetical protein